MKLSKIIVSLGLILAIIIGLNINANAATWTDKVEGTSAVITERGADATISYKVSTDTGDIISYYSSVKWDNTLATLTLADIVHDNTEDATITVDGTTSELIFFSKEELPTSTITLNFKNVLPEGTTATEFAPTYEVLEYLDDDLASVDLTGLIVTQAKITLELPISVAITNKVTELKQAATKTFTTELVNDINDKGVAWTVTGNTSASTTVDSAGLITVGADEAIGSSLVVTATSVADATAKDSVTIKVTDKNLNIDTDADGKPDLNIDVDGDGKPDVNVDTDANGEADKNLTQETDKNKPNYVEPGTTDPIYNVDTDEDGKPDYNLAYELLDTEAALAIIAKVEGLNRKLYTAESLANMDTFVAPVTNILDTNGIARLVTIEAHVDQASLDQATKNLVDAYNALVLIKTTTTNGTTDGNKVTQTGMELPVMGLVSLMVSGSAIVLRRKYLK